MCGGNRLAPAFFVIVCCELWENMYYECLPNSVYGKFYIKITVNLRFFCFNLNTLVWTISYLPLWLKIHFCCQWMIFLLTAFATKNIMLLPADILSQGSNIIRHILSSICIHIKNQKTASLNLHNFDNFLKTQPPCLPKRVKLKAVIRQCKKKISTPLNVSFFSLLPCCSKLEGQILKIGDPT